MQENRKEMEEREILRKGERYEKEREGNGMGGNGRMEGVVEGFAILQEMQYQVLPTQSCTRKMDSFSGSYRVGERRRRRRGSRHRSSELHSSGFTSDPDRPRGNSTSLS